MAKQFEVGGKLNGRKWRKARRKMERYLEDQFPRQVHDDFVKNTPKASGNARNKTTLRRAPGGWRILGDYPYSGVIDQGKYPNPPKQGTGKTRNGYSTQAPDGIVEPTLKQARKRFDKFMRRIK